MDVERLCSSSIVRFRGHTNGRPPNFCSSVKVMDERSGIVFGTEFRFPKVFVRRFETKVKVETVSEDEDYFAGVRIHRVLYWHQNKITCIMNKTRKKTNTFY